MDFFLAKFIESKSIGFEDKIHVFAPTLTIASLK